MGREGSRSCGKCDLRARILFSSATRPELLSPGGGFIGTKDVLIWKSRYVLASDGTLTFFCSEAKHFGVPVVVNDERDSDLFAIPGFVLGSPGRFPWWTGF